MQNGQGIQQLEQKVQTHTCKGCTMYDAWFPFGSSVIMAWKLVANVHQRYGNNNNNNDMIIINESKNQSQWHPLCHWALQLHRISLYIWMEIIRKLWLLYVSYFDDYYYCMHGSQFAKKSNVVYLCLFIIKLFIYENVCDVVCVCVCSSLCHTVFYV